MGYTPPYKYTTDELKACALQDAETDLRCAIRDNMPTEYIDECRKRVDKLQRNRID
jgi:hypothetical protein